MRMAVSANRFQPCTLRDFMNYLKYVELDAENLQFFLWFRDYSRRFNELPDSEKALSPEWSANVFEKENQTRPQKLISVETKAIFKGTDFANEPKAPEVEKSNPFYTPPRTANGDMSSDADSFDYQDGSLFSGEKVDHAQRATGAFEGAGLPWKPCELANINDSLGPHRSLSTVSVQPFREEVSRIISIYIADNGTRQLNLSSKERTGLLHALQNTTHPSAFREVVTTVEWSLRCQAHPNFIRWTICNGNPPRVAFARGLGVAGIVIGFTTAILLTLSSAGRAWRVLSLIAFFIGISTLIAAWKGMCVVLHGMHHRHLRPWELFTSDDELAGYDIKSDSYDTVESQDSSNSYEDEPWIAKYEKRNIIRKIFDREIWIQEPALRQIQDTIFVQAVLGAFVFSAVVVGVFCAIPSPHYY
jgi:hypothetical protein